MCRSFLGLFGFCLVAVLSACSGGLYPLRSADLEPVSADELLGRQPCRLPKFELVDRRSQKTLGQSPGGRAFEFVEMESWLRDLLQNSTTRDPDRAPIRIEIRRARVLEKDRISQFQMAVRVRLRINDAPAIHSYRATAIGSSQWKRSAQLVHPLRETLQTIARAIVRGEGICGPAGAPVDDGIGGGT